jgi:hypothetical protein
VWMLMLMLGFPSCPRCYPWSIVSPRLIVVVVVVMVVAVTRLMWMIRLTGIIPVILREQEID